MKEEIIRTEKIYDGKIVNLRVHDVRLPDGNVTKREVVQHNGAVAMIPMDSEQNVYLVRQYRIAADKIMLEIPAGTLELNEDPRNCAIRELQEEIQHKPNTLEPLGGLHPAGGYNSEYIHLFYVTDLEESTLDGDVDEFIEVVKMPLSDALALIDSDEITDAKTIIGLLRVARRLNI